MRPRETSRWLRVFPGPRGRRGSYAYWGGVNPARVTAIALILVAGLAVVVLVRSGGGAGSGAARPPDDPQELSARLAVNDARLRQAIGTWRAGRGSATGPGP